MGAVIESESNGSDGVRNHAGLIWGIAELLRGDYKQADYGKVILPMVVMRRLDQSIEGTKAAVLEEAAELDAKGIDNVEPVLVRVAGQSFFNRSKLSFPQLLDDPANIAQNLRAYIDGFSFLAREVMEKFDFERQIDKLERSNLLYQAIGRVCDVDLHPNRVSNLEMGYLFEELIRRFSEQSNETAGEHFTPREVVRLMGNLLLDGDEQALTQEGVIRTVYDCACGTGGMLSEVEAHIRSLNAGAKVHLYGQELNEESYAICLADMLVKGQYAANIVFGNSFSEDGHRGERFHYGIANPPFGVDWSKVEGVIRDEHANLGFDGRFGPGLPSKSDGQLLFLLHLISKMRDSEDGGSRIAIVHNGSPLFSGAAGSGPSEIRRWVIENDYLEAIVAMPEQLFYNTGIASYVWLVTNRKSPERVGKVQLIDAREKYVKMRKSLGEKRREISPDQIAEITSLHGAFEEGDLVKIVPNESFGYRTVVVEQPLRARWEVSADTWAGVAEDKPLAKLDEEASAALVSALDALDEQQFAGEDACGAAMKKVAVGAGIAKPAAPLVKALSARCLVRDPETEPIRNKKGQVVPDPQLRDTENIPLADDVTAYMAHEVTPHIPDAWVSDAAGKVGYEIPFTRIFYSSTPQRPSSEIKAELAELEGEIQELLGGMLE